MNHRSSYVLIQRSRDGAFVRCRGGFLRLNWHSRSHWWRRRWRWWRRRRRRRRHFGLRLGFRFRLDKRNVRRGEQPGTRPIRARPRPPVRIFLHDLHDKLPLSERQLVVFCGLQVPRERDYGGYDDITTHLVVVLCERRYAMVTVSRSWSCLLRLGLGLVHAQLCKLQVRGRVRSITL
jgi:hypothetical protein